MERLCSWLIRATLAALILVCLFDGLSHAAVGYQSRPCGFDMDDDDRVGEDGTQKFCQGGAATNQQCSTNTDCPSSTCATTGSTTNQDCNVCDGVTLDPDGDGDPEDLIYVDCNSGNDTTGDGTPGTPYKTLSKALTMLDGAGDGDEDIICVRATCSQENGSGVSAQTLNKAGVTGNGPAGVSYNERPAQGNDGQSFRYPFDPFMVVGWDTDNDGQYPPYDSTQSEPAIFDAYNAGQSGAANYITFLSVGSADNVELAHFTVKNYGRAISSGTQYALAWTGISGYADHHHVHDIVLDSVNRGSSNNDARRVVYLNNNGAGNGVRYLSFENVEWRNTGSWPFRGWNSDEGPFRLKNVSSIEPVPQTTSTSILPFKVWDVNHIEVTDSRFQRDPSSSPSITSDSSRALYFDAPTQDVWVQGNVFEGFGEAVLISYRTENDFTSMNGPFAINRNQYGFPDGVTSIGGTAVFARVVSETKVDGVERSECSTCTGTTTCAAEYSAGPNVDCDCDGVGSGGGGPSYVSEVEIESNVVDFNDLGSAEIASFVTYQNGSNCPDILTFGDVGPLKVNGNTVLNFKSSTTSGTHAAIVLGRDSLAGKEWDFKYHPGSVYVYNNIISGAGQGIINWKRGNSDVGPLTGDNYYTPGTTFYADKNVYDGTADFNLGGASVDGIGAWRTAIGGTHEDLSLTCVPDFEADGYHLDVDEDGGCNVVDNGNNTYCPAYDIDVGARPINTTCDIGADEVATSGGGTSPGSVQLAASSYSTNEDATAITVSVTRTAGSDGAASVDYVVNTVSAIPGASCDGSATKDYTTTSGTLSWTDADAATKTFTITTCSDSTIEGTETASIVLSNATGATLGAPSTAGLTILDAQSPVGSSPYFNTVDGVKTGCSSTSGTSLSIGGVAVTGGPSHPDRVLIVTIGGESAYNSTTPSESGCNMNWGAAAVTWNSQSLTRLASRIGHSGTVSSVCSSIFYLLNPAAVSSAVSITFPGTVTSAQASAFNIYGADQNEPTAKSTDGGPNTTLGESTDITTLLTDSMVIDAMVLRDRVGGGNGAAGGGQVERADVSCASTGSHLLSSTRETPTPITIPIAWSWASGSAGAFSHSMAAWPAVQPAVATTTTTTTNTNTTTTLPVLQAPTQGWRCVGPCVPVQ